VKGKISKSRNIGRDSKTLPATTDGNRWKSSKDVEELNNAVDQQDPIAIGRTLHPQNSIVYTLSKCSLEHIPSKTISWAIKQTSVNIKELK
jgi:hypothetical protein